MKHALSVALLTLLLSATARASDLCSAGADPGRTVTVRGRNPLGWGTRVTVYPNGVAIRVAPDKVVLLVRSTNSKWVAIDGNYAKGVMHERGNEVGNNHGIFEIKQSGNQLTIRRREVPRRREKDPPNDPGYVMRVTTIADEDGKPSPAEVSTTVAFETQAGGDLGTFTTRIPINQHKAGMAAIDALEKGATQELRNRPALPSTGSTDLTETQRNLVRTGCGNQITDMTGQGGGGSVQPAGPTAPGG